MRKRVTTPSASTPTASEQQRDNVLNSIRALSRRNLLAIILLIATTLRLTSALVQGENVGDLPGVYDQISYHRLAERVVNGYGFSFAEDHWPATRGGEPTAHWSYFYTLYLAVVYKLFGVHPVLARVLQALVVGILQPVLTWRIGRRLFGEKAGLIAAAISAVYVYFFYYAGALITESFYIVCILWTFDVALQLTPTTRETGTKGIWRTWAVLGLAMGLTVLLRQVFLLFLPFLFLWIWWSAPPSDTDKGWKRFIRWSTTKGLLLVTIVLALMILPFTVRNYRAFGTVVLLNTNAGFAFYWGNHPIHGTHFIPLLPPTGPSYYDLIPPELRHLNEGLLDKALLKEAIRIIVDDPGRFLLLSLSRIEEYFKFWPSRNSGLISNFSRVASFGILLPFVLYGIWSSLRRVRVSAYAEYGRYLLIVLLFITIYAVIHLLTWTLIRYRLPIDALLVIFAAVGLEALQVRFSRLRHGNLAFRGRGTDANRD